MKTKMGETFPFANAYAKVGVIRVRYYDKLAI